MANELLAETEGQTGLTCYFVLKNTAGLVWNGSGFAAYSTANRNLGAITATGRADGSYVADIPSVNAGAYYYSLWQQLGAGAAETDTLLAGGGEIEWGGSAVGVYPVSRVAGALWDELASSHQTVDTLGYQLSQLYTGTVSTSGVVADAAATATSFKTNLTAVTGFYDDMLLVFTSGALAGQARPVNTFTQVNGVFAFDEGFTSAPGNGDAFAIQVAHVHPVTQIADACGTGVVAESYAANGVAPTRDQALMAIHQMLMQFAISGTSYTVRKLDNSTTAFVVTLDSATTPTSAART